MLEMFAVVEIIEMFLPFETLDILSLTTLTVVKRNVKKYYIYQRC